MPFIGLLFWGFIALAATLGLIAILAPIGGIWGWLILAWLVMGIARAVGPRKNP